MPGLSREHRAWLRQATRTLVSVFLSDAVAQLCGLNEPGWALITATIVTANSVSGTWTAGRDQIIGTLIGAVAGTLAIALTLAGFEKMPVFAAILAPLALLAAARPSLRLTCVTLIVVFLFPSPGGPFERPFDRVLAILIGAGVSLVVSYAVFRPKARAAAFAAAAGMLEALQQLLAAVMARAEPDSARDALTESANAALRTLADAVIEARREHVGALEQSDPALVRLVPMLRRLQSDVLFVSRALDELPDAPAQLHHLEPAREALLQVFEGLRGRCAAIAHGRRDAAAPSESDTKGSEQGGADGGIAALDRTLASLGDSAGVPLRFTLQMLRRDLDDMRAAIA